MRTANIPLRVVLFGERLESAHRILRGHGMDCRYIGKKDTPIDRYPGIYQDLDCVVVSSVQEVGPLCLFEALATGVPVVSTPVGWAPRLIVNGVNGFIVRSVAEIAQAIRAVHADREAWFARREEIRASLGGYTLEGWVRENIDLAVRLADAAVVDDAAVAREPAAKPREAIDWRPVAAYRR